MAQRAFRRPRPWAGPLAIGLLAAAAVVPHPLASQGVEFPVRIQGPRAGGENLSILFSAVLQDRPLRVDESGLSPTVAATSGGPIPVPWEPPVTLFWDFGDGTPPAEVHEYTSASHVYADNGDYTITLTVRDTRGVLATTTHDIAIRNRDPTITRSAAVEIDPGTRTVELTASADDADDDEITYRWDFGDGSGEEGVDLWRVQHRYAQAGEYEAVVAYVDDDGGMAADTVDVLVTGTAIVADEDPDEPGPEPESVISGFDATISGGVSGAFVGDMRSFAGLHLSRISSGVCRFLFTAWDPTNLAFVMAIMDLNGIPEGGGRYRFDGGWLSLMLEDDAEAFEATRTRGPLGMLNAEGLGGLVNRITGGLGDLLPAAERARMADSVGVDPTAAARDNPRPTAASSPWGLEEDEGFRSAGGLLELTFVPGSHATGTFDVVLENTSSRPPAGLEQVRMQGTFALDLQAARREGVLNYAGCGPRELEVTAHHPDDGAQHFYTLKPPVRVRFDRPVDPATLSPDNVQIVYPAAGSGDTVAVRARMLRDPRTVWLIPERDLEPGARYTVRVKAGSDGVMGRDGAKLTTEDGSDWWSFSFETEVDLVPDGSGELAAACNLFQSARDAPLIRGKPAVARVAALWQAPEGVDSSAHVTDFEGRVILYGAGGTELASAHHRFVRPDLHERRGVNRARAEHTAQLYGFRPDPDAAPGYTIGIEVPTSDGDRAVRYRARCPTTYWDYAPIITIDYLVFDVGEWKLDPDELQATMPVIRRLIAEAEAYAMQLFPLAEIRGAEPRIVSERRGLDFAAGCNAGCVGPAVEEQMKAESDADIVVGLLPHDTRVGDQVTDPFMGVTGGNASSEFTDGQGAVVSLVSRSTAWFQRYVFALVHEWGHVLELEHLPTVDAAERARASALRDGDVPILYRGIEGFRLTPSGDAGWNKSSVEGNAQDAVLAPLMFPSTVPAEAAFIANHHYREVQAMFERLGWSRNAGGEE